MDRDGHCVIGVVLQCDDAVKAELYVMVINEWGFSMAQFLHWGAPAMYFIRGIFIHGNSWHKEHGSPKGLVIADSD
jgi:hypothetical protein